MQNAVFKRFSGLFEINQTHRLCVFIFKMCPGVCPVIKNSFPPTEVSVAEPRDSIKKTFRIMRSVLKDSNIKG